MYQIINSGKLAQNKGVLSAGDLPGILKPARAYPKRRHPFITEMMRKFELCFDFPDQPNERFLVPDLLSREEPHTGDWEDSLAFQYHYDVLPGSIISRFILRMSSFISGDTYWRNGVVLEYEEGRNKALVRADLEDRKLFIYVSGSEATRREFLGIIRADLRRIHETIPSLAVEQKVPVPGHPEVIADFGHLLDLEDMGEPTFVPVGLRERVDVKQILNGVEPEEARLELRRATGGDVYHAEKIYIGDRYSAEQVGVMGPAAHAENISFTQRWEELGDSVDIQALAEQLADLQGRLKVDANEPEEYEAIADVGRAEAAARRGDGPGALRHLAAAGRLVLDVGAKIGAELAVAASKAGLGI